MKPHTRAMIAATAFALVTGKAVAGVRDHAGGCDRRIAAEARGNRVQGYDGDRAARFGGTLPEVHDEGDRAFVAFEVSGSKVTGFDRGSSTHFEAVVADGMVQVYDHAEQAWFAYDLQDGQAGQGYYRSEG
ncbi:MAG: hypothetical protein KGN34_09430 [Sphingomonadales bacterium]|nr:hypothetical protein [Sphingomonadales bacterium]